MSGVLAYITVVKDFHHWLLCNFAFNCQRKGLWKKFKGFLEEDKIFRTRLPKLTRLPSICFNQQVSRIYRLLKTRPFKRLHPICTRVANFTKRLGRHTLINKERQRESPWAVSLSVTWELWGEYEAGQKAELYLLYGGDVDRWVHQSPVHRVFAVLPLFIKVYSLKGH